MGGQQERDIQIYTNGDRWIERDRHRQRERAGETVTYRHRQRETVGEWATYKHTQMKTVTDIDKGRQHKRDRHTQMETEGESDRQTQMEAGGESDRHTQREAESVRDRYTHTNDDSRRCTDIYIYIHTQTQIVGKTVIMIYTQRETDIQREGKTKGNRRKKFHYFKNCQWCFRSVALKFIYPSSEYTTFTNIPQRSE